MAREFRPVRFFVLAAIAVFLTCGAVAFFSKRAEHGRNPEERAGYALGVKAGAQAPPDAKHASPAELNQMAQARFKREGTGDKSNWDLGFENGYEEGFRKTHPAP
jgi:hypothetical protein